MQIKNVVLPQGLAALLRRAPLAMMTIIFSLVGFRYLVHPVRSAAEVGIAFTSPEGVAIVRVAFAGFPLAIAILSFRALFSPRWRLAGLHMVLTVDGVVIMVRTVGFWADHSFASAGLLVPEAVLLALSIVAIGMESSRRPGERNGAET